MSPKVLLRVFNMKPLTVNEMETGLAVDAYEEKTSTCSIPCLKNGALDIVVFPV